MFTGQRWREEKAPVQDLCKMGSKTERAVFHVFTGRRWREERAPLYTRPVQDGLREARLNLLCFVGSQAIWGEGKEPLYQIMTMAWERQDLTCDVLCVHRPGGGAPVQDLYKMGSGTERAILYVCPQAGGRQKKEHLYKILYKMGSKTECAILYVCSQAGRRSTCTRPVQDGKRD